jgi:hypothetical protein
MSNKIECPLLKKEIAEGYCWELCNIANDSILMNNDKVSDWQKASEICRRCGRYE